MSAIDPNMPIDQAIHSESKYLTKHDLPDGGLIATIASWSKVQLSASEPEKYILNFKGDTKPLVMNVTNRNRLMAAFPDCQGLADFVNKRIRIYFDHNVEFQGKLVGGIRIDAKAPEFDDDVPF